MNPVQLKGPTLGVLTTVLKTNSAFILQKNTDNKQISLTFQPTNENPNILSSSAQHVLIKSSQFCSCSQNAIPQWALQSVQFTL